MKFIQLTQNRQTTVDDDIYEWLMDLHLSWQFIRSQNGQHGYAIHAIKNHPGWWMHRLIMNAPPDKEVDHIDRNGLNNQRSNLRLATHGQNAQHHAKGKGVRWSESRRKWQVSITANGVTYFLGRYLDYEEALAVRAVAEKEYFGNWAP